MASISAMDPAQTINRLKQLLAGKWAGEGFAKFPTIDSTAYAERTEFRPDELKDAIFFEQKTWYKNDTPNNGHTVFWDTGFILLRDDHILLHSAQVGGRIEQYRLTESAPTPFVPDSFVAGRHAAGRFVFDTTAILVDPKATRSQRIFTISADMIDYELNMATHQAPEFQNHLKAHLRRTA